MKTDSVRQLLQAMTNKDNASEMAKIAQELDKIDGDYTKLEQEHNSLKDDFLEMVKGTALAKRQETPITPPEEKSLDEIMQEELKKIADKK